MRDVLLGNTPVFWMQETEYLWMCLATTVGIFFLWSYLAEKGEGETAAGRCGLACLPLLATTNYENPLRPLYRSCQPHLFESFVPSLPGTGYCGVPFLFFRRGRRSGVFYFVQYREMCLYRVRA